MAPSPTPRARTAKVGPFFAKKLRELDAALGETLPRVHHGADSEAIHDMRVAIRRMRTLLKLARAVYGRFHADAVRQGFTCVQRATGTLRDEEVLYELLAEVHLRDETFIAWKQRRAALQRQLRRAVVARLRAGDLARARVMLRAIVALPVRPSRNGDLGKFARKCVERARKRVDARRDVDTSDVTGLHELRIAYKELRYGAEQFDEVLPRDLSAMAAPASTFQKRLGEIHDVDMAIACVMRARMLSPMARARTLGQLNALREKKVAKYAEDMSPALAAPSEPAAPAV